MMNIMLKSITKLSSVMKVSKIVKLLLKVVHCKLQEFC